MFCFFFNFFILFNIIFRLNDIGNYCTSNKQCIKTLICDDNTCQCPFYTIYKNHKCVKKNKIKYDSSEKLNYLTALATFIDIILRDKNKKITNDSLLYQKNEFIKKIQNNKFCLPNQILFNKKCLNKKLSLGAICAVNTQCTQNAQCIKFRCKCKNGYAGNNNKCFGNYLKQTILFFFLNI